MMGFKVGDLVEVVKLTRDAGEAVSIGSVYPIVEIGGDSKQPYLLGNTRRSAWWVAAECLAHVALENE